MDVSRDRAVKLGVMPVFGKPRPAMRGRYLIRSARSALIMAVIDTLLDLLNIGRTLPVVAAQPRRIVVADWTGLGNVLLALPTLRLLRSIFPDAEIGFLTGSWARDVLEGTGLYDHLHLVDHFPILMIENGERPELISWLGTASYHRCVFMAGRLVKSDTIKSLNSFYLHSSRTIP
jgi:hypothetical protein